MRSRAPQTSEAARCRAKLLVAIWTFAVVVRLILINQPYVDYWSWRQSDVAAIARNFFEYGFRFGYPQIDWAGGSGGYVGREFPILPFLAAICYKFTGIHESIGRCQSVIFFAISLPFFFCWSAKLGMAFKAMRNRQDADAASRRFGLHFFTLLRR